MIKSHFKNTYTGPLIGIHFKIILDDTKLRHKIYKYIFLKTYNSKNLPLLLPLEKLGTEILKKKKTSTFKLVKTKQN